MSPQNRRGMLGEQILGEFRPGLGMPGQSQGQGWLPSLPAASCQGAGLNKGKSTPSKTAMSSNSAPPTLGPSPHPSPVDTQPLPRPLQLRLGHHHSQGVEKGTSCFAMSSTSPIWVWKGAFYRPVWNRPTKLMTSPVL